MPDPYVICLRLTGRQCLIAGGGEVAERKLLTLRAAGARITVVAPEVTAIIEQCAEDGDVTLIKRQFMPGDVQEKILVVAATDDPALNQEIARCAHAEHALVNVVDAPEDSDFFVPSSISRGDLSITISTGGKVPALSKRIRQELEAQFGTEFEPYIKLLEQGRKKIYAQGTLTDAEKQQLIDRMLDLELLVLLKSARYTEAEALINTFLQEHGV